MLFCEGKQTFDGKRNVFTHRYSVFTSKNGILEAVHVHDLVSNMHKEMPFVLRMLLKSMRF